MCSDYQQKCYYDKSYCEYTCAACQHHKCVKIGQNGEETITCPCNCFQNCAPTARVFGVGLRDLIRSSAVSGEFDNALSSDDVAFDVSDADPC